MTTEQSFSNVVYEGEMGMEDRELAAFIGVVTELFGAAQARFSAEDWLAARYRKRQARWRRIICPFCMGLGYPWLGIVAQNSIFLTVLCSESA